MAPIDKVGYTKFLPLGGGLKGRLSDGTRIGLTDAASIDANIAEALRLNIKKAASAIRSIQQSLTELLNHTDKLIDISEQASEKNISSTKRRILDAQFQNASGKFSKTLKNLERETGVNPLDRSSFNSMLEGAGISAALGGRISSVLEALGGKDGRIGIEAIKAGQLALGEPEQIRRSSRQNFSFTINGVQATIVSDDAYHGGSTIQGAQIIGNSSTEALFSTNADYLEANPGLLQGIAYSDTTEGVSSVYYNDPSPTGNYRLLSADGEGRYLLVEDTTSSVDLKLYDRNSGTTVRTIVSRWDEDTYTAGISDDGAKLAFFFGEVSTSLKYSEDQGATLNTLDVTGGLISGKLAASDEGFIFSSNATSLGADGASFDLFIANGYSDSISIRRINIAALEEGAVLNKDSISISDDGAVVAFSVDTAGESGKLYLYNVNTGKASASALTNVIETALNADGSRLAVAVGGEAPAIEVYDLEISASEGVIIVAQLSDEAGTAGSTEISFAGMLESEAGSGVFNTSANYLSQNPDALNVIAWTDSKSGVTSVQAGSINMTLVSIDDDGRYGIVLRNAPYGEGYYELWDFEADQLIQTLGAESAVLSAKIAGNGTNWVLNREGGNQLSWGDQEHSYAISSGLEPTTVEAVAASDVNFAVVSNMTVLGGDGSRYDVFLSDGYGENPAFTKISFGGKDSVSQEKGHLDISDDGGTLVLVKASDSHVYLRTDGGKELIDTGLVIDGEGSELRISGDGARLAISDNTAGTVKLYDVRNPASPVLLSEATGISGTISALSINNDGSSVSFSNYLTDGVKERWETYILEATESEPQLTGVSDEAGTAGATSISFAAILGDSTTQGIFNTTGDYLAENSSALGVIAYTDTDKGVSALSKVTPDMRILYVGDDGQYGLVERGVATPGETGQYKLVLWDFENNEQLRWIDERAAERDLELMDLRPDGRIWVSGLNGLEWGDPDLANDQSITADVKKVAASESSFAVISNDAELGGNGSRYDVFISNGYGASPNFTQVSFEGVESVSINHSLDMSDDGGRVLLVKESDKHVYIIDTATRELYDTGIAVSASGVQLRISGDGNTVLITDETEHTVALYDITDLEESAQQIALATNVQGSILSPSINNDGTAASYSIYLSDGVASRYETYLMEYNAPVTGVTQTSDEENTIGSTSISFAAILGNSTTQGYFNTTGDYLSENPGEVGAIAYASSLEGVSQVSVLTNEMELLGLDDRGKYGIVRQGVLLGTGQEYLLWDFDSQEAVKSFGTGSTTISLAGNGTNYVRSYGGTDIRWGDHSNEYEMEDISFTQLQAANSAFAVLSNDTDLGGDGSRMDVFLSSGYDVTENFTQISLGGNANIETFVISDDAEFVGITELGSRNIYVYDVSGEAFTGLGLTGRVVGMNADGTRLAYIDDSGANEVLKIYDISDLGRPTFLGSIDLDDALRSFGNVSFNDAGDAVAFTVNIDGSGRSDEGFIAQIDLSGSWQWQFEWNDTDPTFQLTNFTVEKVTDNTAQLSANFNIFMVGNSADTVMFSSQANYDSLNPTKMASVYLAVMGSGIGGVQNSIGDDRQRQSQELLALSSDGTIGIRRRLDPADSKYAYETFEISSGKILQTITTLTDQPYPEEVALSPDGSKAVWAMPSEFDPEYEIRFMTGADQEGVPYGADGSDGFNLQGGTLYGKISASDTYFVFNAITTAFDGGGTYKELFYGTYDSADDRIKIALADRDISESSHSISDDGAIIAYTAADDGELFIYNTVSESRVSTGLTGVTATALDADGNRIAIHRHEGEKDYIEIYDIAETGDLSLVQTQQVTSLPILSLTINDSGTAVGYVVDGNTDEFFILGPKDNVDQYLRAYGETGIDWALTNSAITALTDSIGQEIMGSAYQTLIGGSSTNLLISSDSNELTGNAGNRIQVFQASKASGLHTLEAASAGDGDLWSHSLVALSADGTVGIRENFGVHEIFELDTGKSLGQVSGPLSALASNGEAVAHAEGGSLWLTSQNSFTGLFTNTVEVTYSGAINHIEAANNRAVFSAVTDSFGGGGTYVELFYTAGGNGYDGYSSIERIALDGQDIHSSSFSVSADGTRIAYTAASNGALYVYDAAGDEVSYDIGLSGVGATAMSSDGSRVAVYRNDGANQYVEIYDITDPENAFLVLSQDISGQSVTSLTMNSAGTAVGYVGVDVAENEEFYILTTGDPELSQYQRAYGSSSVEWDLTNGEVSEITDNRGAGVVGSAAGAIAGGTSGNLFLTSDTNELGGNAGNHLRVYQAEADSGLQTLEAALSDGQEVINHKLVAMDAAAAIGIREIWWDGSSAYEIFDLATGKTYGQAEGVSFALAPDGTKYAGKEGDTLYLRRQDEATGEFSYQADITSISNLGEVRAADERVVFSATTDSFGGGGGGIYVALFYTAGGNGYDSYSSVELIALDSEDIQGDSFAVSADGKHIAYTAAGDGALYIYDTAREVSDETGVSGVSATAMSSDGSRLAVVRSADSTVFVELYDISTPDAPILLGKKEVGESPVTNLGLNSTGTVLSYVQTINGQDEFFILDELIPASSSSELGESQGTAYSPTYTMKDVAINNAGTAVSFVMDTGLPDDKDEVFILNVGSGSGSYDFNAGEAVLELRRYTSIKVAKPISEAEPVRQDLKTRAGAKLSSNMLSDLKTAIEKDIASIKRILEEAGGKEALNINDAEKLAAQIARNLKLFSPKLINKLDPNKVLELLKD